MSHAETIARAKLPVAEKKKILKEVVTGKPEPRGGGRRVLSVGETMEKVSKVEAKRRYKSLVKKGKIKPLDKTVVISERTLRRLNRALREAADIIENEIGNIVKLYDPEPLWDLADNLQVICAFYSEVKKRRR